MDNVVLRQFTKMGARVVVRPADPLPDWQVRNQPGVRPRPIRLDIKTDRRGEYFDLAVDAEQAALQVLDIRANKRHLLLMSRNLDSGEKEKFLCGHDERHWFVAAVPPEGVANIADAMEALKPAAVQTEQTRRGVRPKNRNRRRNAAFIRQGEWFFVPADIRIDKRLVLRNEPLRRGRGKPHMVDFLTRIGGETVYVSRRRPNGLTESEYRSLIQQKPSARAWGWKVMRRDPEVYVKGRIRHADHQTVVLDGWHRVLMNRETDAPAMQHVAFLD